jgi:predicted PurR-regulated permease PerM
MASAANRQQTTRPDTPKAASPLRQGLLLTLGISLGLSILAVLWLFARPLALIIIAIVIGEALTPIVDFVSRKMPRAWAIIVIYLSFFLTMGVLLWFLLAPLVSESQALVRTLPESIDQAEAWVEQQSSRLGGLPIVDFLSNNVQNITTTLANLPRQLFSSLFEILLVVFLSLYWLMSRPQARRFILSLFPPERRERALEVLDKLGDTVGGYVRGVTINVLIIGAISYIGLSLIGLPFAIVLAVIAGLLEIIPIVGPIIAGFIIVSFALSQSLQMALITLVFYLIVQQIEGNILMPLVMRSQTDISPFLILVAVVLGAGVGGLLGVLVAIPLTGAIKVLTTEVLAPMLRQRIDAEEPVA